MKTVQVPLDADLVAVLEEVGRAAKDSVRELIVMELYREGLISSGKAAELIGLERVEFIRSAGEQGIPYIRMNPEELRAEIERAKAI
jgi:predicted HTH domain antitoxin